MWSIVAFVAVALWGFHLSWWVRTKDPAVNKGMAAAQSAAMLFIGANIVVVVLVRSDKLVVEGFQYALLGLAAVCVAIAWRLRLRERRERRTE
jgi:hypothetical protein